MRRRLAQLSERASRAIDRVLVGVILVVSQVDLLLNSKLHGPLGANMAIFAVMSLALLWRRSQPLAALAVVLAGAAVMAALLTPPPDTFAAVLILVTACYSTGRHLEGRRALAGLGLAVGRSSPCPRSTTRATSSSPPSSSRRCPGWPDAPCATRPC